MQVVEVRIPGQYWDSFIYNGKLYLFTLNGDIMTYHWDRLVRSVPVEEDCRPLFWQFLARGRSWYSPELQKLLESPKILQEIRTLTAKMTADPYDLSPKGLREALVEICRSPAHPHTDVEGFYDTIYLSSSSGVHAAPLTRKLANNFRMSTDIPALRVACSYGSMAVAAGSEGMYEQTLISLQDWPFRNEPVQLSTRNCSACSWASFDVIGTAGPGEAGFVAAFTKPHPEEAEMRLRSLVGSSRHLLGVVGSDELFPSADGLLFGADNLLIMAARSSLFIDGWNPFLRRDNQGVDVQYSLFSRQKLEVGELTDDVIDGAATVFGIVVEMDSALLVRGVDGTITAFGEPVNWRTYPRSYRYLNQLHIVYENYVGIYAFVEDYFTPSDERGPAVQRPRSKRST